MSKVKLLLYCTKAKPLLWKYFSIDYEGSKYKYDEATILNGKIVAECDCEKVEEIELLTCLGDSVMNGENREIDIKDFLRHSCLTYTQLEKYLKHVDETKSTFTQVGYALYLSNLNIFNKPYQLDDFFLLGRNGNVHVLEKAPQNMCNVSFKYVSLREEEHIRNDYILISIRPEWLCKILNGEKTIEVRRVVTNKLKKLIGE